MNNCTHYWTVTSECPRCLREELDDAYAEIMKLSPDGSPHSVVFDRAVHDRARKERARILARPVDSPSSLS